MVTGRRTAPACYRRRMVSGMKKKQTVGTVAVDTKDGSLQAATRKTSITKTSIPDDSLNSSPDTGTITSADALPRKSRRVSLSGTMSARGMGL